LNNFQGYIDLLINSYISKNDGTKSFKSFTFLFTRIVFNMKINLVYQILYVEYLSINLKNSNLNNRNHAVLN